MGILKKKNQSPEEKKEIKEARKNFVNMLKMNQNSSAKKVQPKYTPLTSFFRRKLKRGFSQLKSGIEKILSDIRTTTQDTVSEIRQETRKIGSKFFSFKNKDFNSPEFYEN